MAGWTLTPCWITAGRAAPARAHGPHQPHVGQLGRYPPSQAPSSRPEPFHHLDPQPTSHRALPSEGWAVPAGENGSAHAVSERRLPCWPRRADSLNSPTSGTRHSTGASSTVPAPDLHRVGFELSVYGAGKCSFDQGGVDKRGKALFIVRAKHRWMEEERSVPGVRRGKHRPFRPKPCRGDRTVEGLLS